MDKYSGHIISSHPCLLHFGCNASCGFAAVVVAAALAGCYDRNPALLPYLRRYKFGKVELWSTDAPSCLWTGVVVVVVLVAAAAAAAAGGLVAVADLPAVAYHTWTVAVAAVAEIRSGNPPARAVVDVGFAVAAASTCNYNLREPDAAVDVPKPWPDHRSRLKEVEVCSLVVHSMVEVVVDQVRNVPTLLVAVVVSGHMKACESGCSVMTKPGERAAAQGLTVAQVGMEREKFAAA